VPTQTCFLLNGFFFRRAVPAQKLGKVLREGGTRQNHIAADFMGFLLQVSLNMRQKTDDRSAFLEFGFQLGNQAQGLYAGAVEIENNERGVLLPVLLHALCQVLFALDEFNFDVEFARGFLNFGLEKEFINEAEDAGVCVLASGKGLRFGLWVVGGKARARAPGAIAVIAAGKCRPVAVVHWSGINATVLLVTPVASMRISTPRTATTPPPASPSSTGGASWSCIHIGLFVLITPRVRAQFLGSEFQCCQPYLSNRAEAHSVRKTPFCG